MRQDMMEDVCTRDIVKLNDSGSDDRRALTYDEKKAAEAAFRGEPFNPHWSIAAAKVYAGILSARDNMPMAELADSEVAVKSIARR